MKRDLSHRDPHDFCHYMGKKLAESDHSSPSYRETTVFRGQNVFLTPVTPRVKVEICLGLTFCRTTGPTKCKRPHQNRSSVVREGPDTKLGQTHRHTDTRTDTVKSGPPIFPLCSARFARSANEPEPTTHVGDPPGAYGTDGQTDVRLIP